MITGHGDDAYNYPDGIIGDFSSNVPYSHHGTLVAEHLCREVSRIHNYPDPQARQLTQALREHHHLNEGTDILITNGSAESFYLLAHLFSGSKSIITYPSFAEYEDACALYKHDITYLNLKEINISSVAGSRTLWFALPNNPDGYIMPIEKIRALCAEHPDTFIIIDNAYGELCPSSADLIPLHSEFPNLISVHSLTKTFAIPGLRLGYTIASTEVVSALQSYRIPWSVNSLALSAGLFIVRNYNGLRPDAHALCDESEQLQRMLGEIQGLEVYPSLCNFFLCKLLKGTAADLKEYLATQHKLLIRNADNFRGLTAQHFRVSVQGDDLNSLLCHGIKMYLQTV